MSTLPAGQRAREDFPRFGLDQFADRFPAAGPIRIEVGGDVEGEIVLDSASLAGVSRFEQTSDLHCVTTWSAVGLRWGGYRFRDVWEALIAGHTTADVTWLVFRSADGFKMRLPLEDALADDVLLADTLNGEPLCADHGAPVRFVAPQHYGYKNAKHVVSLSATAAEPDWRSPTPFAFMEHARGRVGHEERGTGVPALLLRWIYRPLVNLTVWKFERAARARV